MEYFDIDGKPIDMTTWAELYTDSAYRLIADDTVGDTAIRTVWTGQYDLELLFRDAFGTAITVNGEWEEIRQYHTKSQAIAGHAEIVAEIRARSTELRNERQAGGPPASGHG